MPDPALLQGPAAEPDCFFGGTQTDSGAGFLTLQGDGGDGGEPCFAPMKGRNGAVTLKRSIHRLHAVFERNRSL